MAWARARRCRPTGTGRGRLYAPPQAAARRALHHRTTAQLATPPVRLARAGLPGCTGTHRSNARRGGRGAFRVPERGRQRRGATGVRPYPCAGHRLLRAPAASGNAAQPRHAATRIRVQRLWCPPDGLADGGLVRSIAATPTRPAGAVVCNQPGRWQRHSRAPGAGNAHARCHCAGASGNRATYPQPGHRSAVRPARLGRWRTTGSLRIAAGTGATQLAGVSGHLGRAVDGLCAWRRHRIADVAGAVLQRTGAAPAARISTIGHLAHGGRRAIARAVRAAGSRCGAVLLQQQLQAQSTQHGAHAGGIARCARQRAVAAVRPG
ncbi:putative uncharacterized protein [Xanthomonas citri pv. punicae str. LMG 859]|nr:putative uncharacterized protein [Xanthomonas citri pv. punicae str. LMG 859]